MFCDLVVKDTKVRPGTGRSEKVKLTHSYPQKPFKKKFQDFKNIINMPARMTVCFLTGEKTCKIFTKFGQNYIL